MKRLLLLWICLISLCLAFSACADDSDANTPPSTEPFVPTVGSTAHVHQFGQWITVIIAYILIVFIMFNGAQRLEKRQMKRYGNNAEYKAYADKTPIIIPLLPIYHLNKQD